MTSTPKTVIDLGGDTEERDRNLADAVARHAAEEGVPPRVLVQLILGCVLGHPWVDDELAESIVMGLAAEFGCEVRNPQHLINGADEAGGYGNEGRE